MRRLQGGKAAGQFRAVVLCRHLPSVPSSARKKVSVQGPPLRVLAPQQSRNVCEIYVLEAEQRHYGTGLSVESTVTAFLPLPKVALSGTWNAFHKRLFINASVP